MPLEYTVAKGSKDHPRFSKEHRSTHIAQIYGDMSDAEYFQRRDDYDELHPEANGKPWRDYPEDLADEAYDEVSDAEITAGSRCGRNTSPSSSRRADHGVPYAYDLSLPDHRDDASYKHGRRRLEERHHYEGNNADQFGHFNIGEPIHVQTAQKHALHSALVKAIGGVHIQHIPSDA